MMLEVEQGHYWLVRAGWVGLAQLSMYRDSPSIAGTAVVGPWLWLLFFATDVESRLVSADYVPILIEQYDHNLDAGAFIPADMGKHETWWLWIQSGF